MKTFLTGLFRAFLALFICSQTTQAQHSNWQLILDNVTTTRIREASGDRPYFNVIYFRSRINQRGSSVVELRSREPNDWVSKREYNGGRFPSGHMMSGNSINIPWWMGVHEWRGVNTIPRDRVAEALRAEIFGAIIVSLDNNNTPPHVARDVLGKASGILRQLLQEQVETGRIVGAATSGNFAPLAERAAVLAKEAVSGAKLLEYFFQLTVGSTFNPDQVTGIHMFLFPAIEGLAPSSQSGSFSLSAGPVTWNARVASPANFTQNLVFEGSGARYTVRARMVSNRCDLNPAIPSLTIRARTGEDDLRAGSQAEAFVILRDGRTVNAPMNRGANWPNRSDRTSTMSLPVHTRLTDIATFGIRFQASGDDWNLEALQVEHGSNIIFSRQGTPLERFSDRRREWRMNLAPCPPSAPPATVSALRIDIRTGDDDLRGGSRAIGRVSLRGGRTVTVNLNNGAEWKNHSLNTATVSLPAGVSLEDILSFRIDFTSGSCFGCSHDNWNVNGITIAAQTAAGPRTLIERRGTPLVRFKGDNLAFSLALR